MSNVDSSPAQPLYKDVSAPVSARVEELLARMTLEEKIGQMTLAEKNSIDPEMANHLCIGGVLSGGSGFPADNSPAAWLEMVGGFLEAIRTTVSPETAIDYDPNGHFAGVEEDGGQTAELGLVFLGETPYAEGFGDRADLALDEADIALLERMRGRCQKLVVVLVTGRPLIIAEQLPLMDALAIAWLPGTEGQGVADDLFGDVPFGRKLPYTWPRGMDQIPLSNIGAGDPPLPVRLRAIVNYLQIMLPAWPSRLGSLLYVKERGQS